MMVFETMVEETRWLVGEPSSTNTRWTSTDNGVLYMKRAINEAYKHVVMAEKWPFRLTTSDTITTVASTRTYTLPTWTGPVVMLRDTTEDRKLAIRDAQSYYAANPDSSVTGDPTSYFYLGISTTSEPTGSNVYTADATTSATSVVDTEPTGATADYYKEWVLYNITRKMYSRITASAGTATETLTLESPIASQASGDTYVIRKRLIQVGLDPIPDAANTINIHHFQLARPLQADYDVPILPDGYEMLPCYGAAAKLIRPTNPELAREYDKIYTVMYNQMYVAWHRPEFDSLPEIPVTDEQLFAGY